MCLSQVDKVYKNPLKKVIKAWKGFSRYYNDPATVCLPMHSYKNSRIIPRGKWIKAVGTKIHYSGYLKPKTYPAGFHITATKAGANYFGRPIRIKVRGIVVVGKQSGYKVFVAKEIYVPKFNEKI